MLLIALGGGLLLLIIIIIVLVCCCSRCCRGSDSKGTGGLGFTTGLNSFDGRAGGGGGMQEDSWVLWQRACAVEQQTPATRERAGGVQAETSFAKDLTADDM